MLNQVVKERIMQKSVPLEGYGVNDLAWNKEDAENLIDEIMEDKIGILGGDVYRLTSTHLEPLPENWSCEPTEKESKEEYYIRSKSESLKYIKNYPVQPGEKILFSITFTEKIV
jgi:hypothetical protein